MKGTNDGRTRVVTQREKNLFVSKKEKALLSSSGRIGCDNTVVLPAKHDNHLAAVSRAMSKSVLSSKCAL